MDLEEIAESFWDQYSRLLRNIGHNLFTALLIILGGKLISLAARKIIKKAVNGRFKMDEYLGFVLRLIINYGIIVVCAILILENFGLSATSLIALVGAAGVTMGLALRDTLSNAVSGIILLFLRPFRKDDLIEFGSTMGRVKEFGLFVTILETIDGLYVSVPNSNLWGPPLKNYTRNDKRRMDLSIMISYDDPLDTAFAVMEKIGQEEPRILQDPPPQVIVQSVGEYGVTIMLRAWAPSDIFIKTTQDLTRVIKESFAEAGLHAPVPRREIKTPIP